MTPWILRLAGTCAAAVEFRICGIIVHALGAGLKVKEKAWSFASAVGAVS